MEGRSAAIRRCCRLGVSIGDSEVCGLCSLPKEVVLNCLAPLSRLDLAAVAMTCESYRSLVTDAHLWDLRYNMGFTKSYLYVCLHMAPEQSPRWFVFHPVQRRLKPVYQHLYETPESSCSFVVRDYGIYHIGGLVNGKPIRDFTYFDCSVHRWYILPPMKMARASASACLIDCKIYVFGGCGDEADSSNWAEVYDVRKRTWDFLSVPSRPKKKIQQSVVLDMKEFYAVDEDGQTFSFEPSSIATTTSMSMCGKTVVSKPGSRDDWCMKGGFLFCRGPRRGTILWCLPHELDWKELEGLKELQHLDIIKLSATYHTSIVIFWIAQPSLELFSAGISLKKSKSRLKVSGKIDWSGAVYKLTDADSVQVLFAGSAIV